VPPRIDPMVKTAESTVFTVTASKVKRVRH